MPIASHHVKPSRPERFIVALMLSLLAHTLLAVGLWYVSQGHDVEDLSHVQVTMVTPEMLAKMQADVKANHADTALSSKTSVKNKASRGDADGMLILPKLNNTPKNQSVEAPQPNVEPRFEPQPEPKFEPVQEEPAIFEPEPVKKPVFEQQFDEPKPQTKPKPKAKPKPKPKTGKPDPAAKQKTSDWAKKQEKIIEEKKRKERIEQAEKDRLRKQQKAEKKAKEREAQKKRDAKRREEQQRLKKLKEAEKNKDKELAKRREAIKKAKQENQKRLDNKTKKNAAQGKKQSLEASGKALGVADAAAEEFGSAGKAVKDDKAKAAKDKETISSYVSQIQRKVTRNWSKNTSMKVTIPVKINLSDSGSVISVRVTKSSGDAELDASIEQAVRDSSPLPVPSDPALRKKHFRTLILKFRTK